MRVDSGRGLRPGGVIRALIRLVVMIVFAFGAGLLYGIVSEEPELLAGHLRGESENVILTAARAGDSTGGANPAPAYLRGASAQASVNSTNEALGGMETKLPRVAASAPEPPRSGARSKRATKTVTTDAERLDQERTKRFERRLGPNEEGRAWAIQVGAFSDESTALRLVKTLRGKGYPTEMLSTGGRGGRFRVRVQPIPGEATAQETAAELKRVERLPTWVLPMEAQ